MPTLEDLIRLNVHFASTRSGRGVDGVLNYTAMRHGFNYLNKTLVFRYEAWNLGAHGAFQLQGAMDKHLREGHLTREPVGAVVVRRLVMGLYHDAIPAGTSTWSKLFNDITIIVLTACFHCRGSYLPGDTVKNKDKRLDLPGLRYSDLQLIAGKAGGVNSIIIKDKMRNTKGTEDDKKAFFCMFQYALQFYLKA